MVLNGQVLHLAFISSKIGKLFFDYLLLYVIWTTPMKFTTITFLRSLVKIKNIKLGLILLSILKLGHLPKMAEKH